MTTVRNRLVNGFTANGFSQLSNIICQLLAVPVLLHYWGIELYGEWLILSTIPAYLAMSEMGFSSVAANEMTMLVAKRDRSEALKVFQSTSIFLIIISVVISIAVLWASLFPITEWLNISSITKADVALIILIMGTQVIFGLQGGLINAGFRCDGNFALGIWLASATGLAETGLLLLSVFLGAQPLVVAMLVLSSRVVSFFVMRLILYRKSPWICYGVPQSAIRRIRQMARPSLAFMGFPIGNAIKNQGMLTVVGMTLGPAFVVVLSTTRTILNVAQKSLGMVSNAVWPEMSTAYGAGDMAMARKLHRGACKLSLWISLCAVLGLFCFGESVLEVWTRGEVPFDSVFFSLMLLVIFVHSLWFASYVVPAATNKHEKLSLVYLVGACLSIAIAMSITRQNGLTGIALSLLVVDLVMVLFVVNLSLSILKDNLKQFLLFVIGPSLDFGLSQKGAK